MQAKASGRNRTARVKARQACLVELERIAVQRAKRVLPRTLLALKKAIDHFTEIWVSSMRWEVGAAKRSRQSQRIN
jgi:hypothetical protein